MHKAVSLAWETMYAPYAMGDYVPYADGNEGDYAPSIHSYLCMFSYISLGQRSKTPQYYTNIISCAVYWAAWQDAAISKIFISTQYAMFAQPM